MRSLALLAIAGLLNTFSVFAQSISCSMTYLTTIQNFDVYRHDASGAIMFKAKMAIDADGSPRAYGPNNSGLDYTANAGSPGNWWGVVTDNNGNPIIQGSSDPYPGMYVSTTSLVNSSYSSTNPSHYTNSEAIPFFVLPHAVVQAGGISIGDVGYVYNTLNGQGCYAIYADAGPSGSLGEGSIYLADQIGINSNARTGGTSQGIIDYIVFPGSGYGQGTIPSVSQINTIGTTEINAAGGTSITNCLGTSGTCGTPGGLSANPVSYSSELLSWTSVSGANSYNIQYKPTRGSTWVTVSSSGNSVTITDLLPATDYQFQVQAICSSAGLYSSAANFTSWENIAPTTQIINPGNWITNTFTASYTDSDNSGGSGLEKSYYQVLDYDGTEWHANATRGFFADNFDSYNSLVWTIPSSGGTWQTASGKLIQSDTSVNNTNIYATLNQNLSNRYLYQFYAKMEAATDGSNQHRFGLHFFCDDASQANRGNSYFMYVRQETSVIEIYKVVSNTFSLVKSISGVTTTFGQWYDYKIIFDRITGKISIYRDDLLEGTWTDSNVLTTSGDYISFRSGNCKVAIDELKIFRSRAATTTITVGAAPTNDIRYQNPSPGVFAAKIKSIVCDSAGNLSSIAYQNLNIDWTAPTCSIVIDGASSDVDTTNSLNTLTAHWNSSSDSNSGIQDYYYSIGNSAGDTSILSWTNNGADTIANISGLSLVSGQSYYINIKTVDSAGLSSICSTNGVTISAISGIQENESAFHFSVHPNPFSENFTVILSQIANQCVKLKLSDTFGRIIWESTDNYGPGINKIDINTESLLLGEGIYTLHVNGSSYQKCFKLIKN